jgi:hypothetical protein
MDAADPPRQRSGGAALGTDRLATGLVTHTATTTAAASAGGRPVAASNCPTASPDPEDGIALNGP